MQDPPKLIFTQLYTRLLLEVLPKPVDRPHAESVTKALRRSRDGDLDSGAVFGRGPGCPARRTFGSKTADRVATVRPSHVVDRGGTAPERLGDVRLGASRIAEKDNRGVSEDASVACREPQSVEFIELLIGQRASGHRRAPSRKHSLGCFRESNRTGAGAEVPLLFYLDNLAGHKTPKFVCWLFEHGIMPLYTPVGGSWLNMAESIQRILKRRALDGQHPTNISQIMTWLTSPTELHRRQLSA